MLGWGEFELEVMRDRNDNVVIVCSIENIDPMGVHTGDSVTVAPQQTLTDKLYQDLRDQAITGDPRGRGRDRAAPTCSSRSTRETDEIVIIEMNPRVSRSSALASKATGFPIAKIAARLAVGYALEEIPNDITELTPASFEPTIDYVVVKWPRFAFEKFPDVDDGLTTHMKSVGEVMAIGRTFGQAFGKAARSLEADVELDDEPVDRGPARALSSAPRVGSASPMIMELFRRGHAPSRRSPPDLGRPLVPARDRRATRRDPEEPLLGRAHLPLGRHLRRRVRRAHPLLLLGLGAQRPPAGSGEVERGDQRERRDPRLGPQPHRPGDRVRLLLRARGHDRARTRAATR